MSTADVVMLQSLARNSSYEFLAFGHPVPGPARLSDTVVLFNVYVYWLILSLNAFLVASSAWLYQKSSIWPILI